MKRLWILLFLSGNASLWATPMRDAVKAFQEKQYPEAESKFRERLSHHPQDPALLYNLGLSLLLQDKYAEAQAILQQAEALASPDLKAQILYNRSLASIAQRQWPEAEKDLQQALAFDNENKQIQENLAWVRQQKDQNTQQKDQNTQQKDQNTQQKQESGESGQEKQEDKQGDRSSEQQASQQSEAKQGQEKAHAQSATPSPDKESRQEQAIPGSAQQKGAAQQKSGQTLTIKELEKQEAEKLLRSLEDKIGRYPMQELQQESGRRSNGKEW